MTDYDAVVYDLDGTLVHLAVDWGAVAGDVLDVYRNAATAPPSRDLWELLSVAPDHGLDGEVEATVASHERAGARNSTQLALLDSLGDHAVPIGVCSLNCEAACRLALECHGVTEAVDVVVGRDSVATQKPHPEPLLEAVRELGVEPERAVFVGDSERDEVTAERAGVAFRYVEDGFPFDV